MNISCDLQKKIDAEKTLGADTVLICQGQIVYNDKGDSYLKENDTVNMFDEATGTVERVTITSADTKDISVSGSAKKYSYAQIVIPENAGLTATIHEVPKQVVGG